MIGASAGLTLRYVGLERSVAGRSERAALMAACTSRAAPSMFRSRLNCSVICERLSELDEVISFTSAMTPSRRSSGVATLDAIVSGLAPGRLALTDTVGKSTCGKGDTGSTKNAATPAIAIHAASSTVPTGRRTNGSERFTGWARGTVALRRAHGERASTAGRMRDR